MDIQIQISQMWGENAFELFISYWKKQNMKMSLRFGITPVLQTFGFMLSQHWAGPAALIE